MKKVLVLLVFVLGLGATAQNKFAVGVMVGAGGGYDISKTLSGNFIKTQTLVFETKSNHVIMLGQRNGTSLSINPLLLSAKYKEFETYDISYGYRMEYKMLGIIPTITAGGGNFKGFNAKLELEKILDDITNDNLGLETLNHFEHNETTGTELTVALGLTLKVGILQVRAERDLTHNTNVFMAGVRIPFKSFYKKSALKNLKEQTLKVFK